jgi:hypothetical protein
LIRLSNISKDDIDHWEKHPVGHGLAGIFHDRDDVCPAGRHIDEISSGSVGKLDSLELIVRAVSNIGAERVLRKRSP